MAKGTVTRKQLLKEPDQFITFSGKLIAFGRSHLRTIWIGAGVFVALIVAAAVVVQISDRNARNASQKVEQALAKYSAALGDTDAKTAYHRVKGDFEEIFDQYGSKSAAKIARIVYGDISYSAGDAETAIAMYTQALEALGDDSSLKNIVLSGLGHAYLLNGANADAIRCFETLSQDKETTMKSGALFNLAWLYDEAGEKEKSRARYEALLAEFPDTMVGDLVKEKINS
jgi:tetratricopeptide (TPR) repeat protein